MELFRLPPFPLVLTVDVPNPNANYSAILINDLGDVRASIESTSDANGAATFILPDTIAMFDEEYQIKIHPGAPDRVDADAATVVMDSLSVIRPYVDPEELAPAPEDVPTYIKYERLARLMIDNIVGGFRYERGSLGVHGIGSNELAVGRRIIQLSKVFENGILIYDSSIPVEDNERVFRLTANRHSIIDDKSISSHLVISRNPFGGHNSIISNLPLTGSNSFLNGSVYQIDAEFGWPVVPQDIQEATKLLVEDMSCEAPNYWSKYVREYETKDYRVDFHRAMFNGTGNLLVDQILKRYWGETLYDNIRAL